MTASTSLIQQLIHCNIPVYPSVTGPQRPISLRSVSWFFGALAWVWVLLFSFTGLGRLAARLCRIPQVPSPVACSVGIALAVLIGGMLNLLHAIYAPVLWVLTGLGLLAYIMLRGQRPEQYRWKLLWSQASSVARLLLITALLLLIYRVSGTVRLANFNVTDDSAAYLALPQKMLATHHFSADSFSERRITSSLGGSYFLQDEVISATSLANIGMADRTLGFILLAGVVLDVGIAFGLSIFQIFLLEFLVFLVPQETYNLTFVVLPTSLLLAMVWLAYRATDIPYRNWCPYAFLAGMVGGATISLKSTYLPAVVALATIPYFMVFFRRRPRLIWILVAWTVFGIIAVLLLWMIAMKITSGTYLFPVLGRGFDYSSRNLFPASSKFPTLRSLVKIVLQGVVLLLPAGILLFSKPRLIQTKMGFSVLISCALAITAINYETSADSIWRYNFPVVFMAVIVFYAAATRASLQPTHPKRSHALPYAGILAMVCMVFYYDLAGTKPTPLRACVAEFTNYSRLYTSLSGRRLASPGLERQYEDVEKAVPPGGSILENVAYPFLFDYRSRNIAIQDWPGAAGPLPGWPFGATSFSVRDYLMRNSIRYFIFGYRYASHRDAESCQDLERSYRLSAWVRQQLWMNILTDLQLDQLQSQFRKSYDDGSIAVIDLSRPVASVSPETRVWAVADNVDMVCTKVAARYFAGRVATLDDSAVPDRRVSSPRRSSYFTNGAAQTEYQAEKLQSQ